MLRVEALGHAEVGELQVTVHAHHDILGLEVAKDDARLVRVRVRVGVRVKVRVRVRVRVRVGVRARVRG